MSHDVFLETDRLILRTFTLDDAHLLYELDSDPEVMRYISKGLPTPLERIEIEILPKWLRFYQEYEHLGFWAVQAKATGNFIGWFHLRPDRYGPEEIELGYRLKQCAWGKGYATEGGKALIEKAFKEWGINRIVSSTLAVNKASQRVMHKCGLKFERTFIYEESLLPGWTEEERKAVKYGLSQSDFNHQK